MYGESAECDLSLPEVVQETNFRTFGVRLSAYHQSKLATDSDGSDEDTWSVDNFTGFCGTMDEGSIEPPHVNHAQAQETGIWEFQSSL